MPSSYQSNFSSGVMGPSLFGRMDLAKYPNGVRRLHNFLIRPQGGVSKRPGTYFIEKFNEPARLIPFVFNEGQAYVLLFAERKILVAHGDSLVWDDNGQPLMVPTSFSYEQAKTITYAQRADMLYLAHRDFAPMKLSRYAHNDWRLQTVDFSPPPPPATNGPYHPPAPGALTVTKYTPPPETDPGDGGGAGPGG
jgi:hypothetical protein